MDRRTYLGIVSGTLVGAGGCTQRDGTTGETETDERDGRTDVPAGSWPMFQVDAANTGFHPTASGPTDSVTERWRFDPNDGRFNTPTVVDGTIYVGTHAGTVYAIDERDGTEEWHFDGAGETASSPAVADGTVYFWPGGSRLYALDAETGEEQWHVRMDPAVRGLYQSNPTVVDGTVYVGGQALDAETGTKKWDYNGREYTPAVDGSSIYVVTGPHVVALDSEDGSEQWRYTAEKRERDVTIRGSPTVTDGTVYVGIRASSRTVTHTGEGRVYALDASRGSKQWQVDTEYPVHGSLAADAEALYVGTVSPSHVPKGKIWALEVADGTTRWQTEVEERVGTSPAVAGSAVYVTSSDVSGNPDTVRALTTDDGSEQWRYDLDQGGTRGSPAIVNETAYVGGSSVYALEQA